jgi:hypothetical protein
MKKVYEKTISQVRKKGGKTLKESVSGRLAKLRYAPHKCPLCSETFTGIKALLSHLKDHCR